MPQAQTYQSEFTGVQMDERFRAVATLAEALTVLEQAIAAKYTKPAGGIPATDLDADVNAALAKANSAVQSLADYYTKSEVDAMVAAVNAQEYIDVATLPAASADTLGKIYLVGPTSGEYARYITTVNGSTYGWVQIGTTEISMANYATKAELSQLDQEVAKAEDVADFLVPFPQPINHYLLDTGISTRSTASFTAREGDTPAVFSGYKTASTGVSDPGIEEATTLTGAKYAVCIKFHVNRCITGAKVQFVLYRSNYTGQIYNTGAQTIESGKDYVWFKSGTTDTDFSNPKYILSIAPPSGYDYSTHPEIAEISIEYIAIFNDNAVSSKELADAIINGSKDGLYMPMSNTVDKLVADVGELGEDITASVPSTSMSAGQAFGLIGTISGLNVKAGDLVYLHITGTATASTIRVYKNKANEPLWSSAAMNTETEITASTDITSILLYSNCTTAGTIQMDVRIQTKGAGLGGRVTALERKLGAPISKWCLIGDSLTVQGKFIPKVQMVFGIETVVNLGVGGITLCDNGGGTFMCDDTLLATIPSDADFITIMGGTNDWAQDKTIGNIDSTDTEEYCGALNHIIDYICTNIPAAHLVILCPPFGMYPNRQGWTDTTGVYNNNGKTVLDYAIAAAAVAEHRGIPCARIGQQTGWNSKNIATFVNSDGAYLHPNQAGGDRMGEVLCGYLLSIGI